MKKTLGKRLLSGALSGLLAASNILTPNLPFWDPILTDAAADDGKIKIEARVIFGDYNDDEEHEYTDSVPYLNLQWRDAEKKDHFYTTTAVAPELVVDDSDARKDWCYQYKYVWEVDPLPEDSGAATGYYVSVDKTGENFLRENYDVYYLPEKQLGPVGQPNEKNYNGSAQQTFFNDDAVVYIFLDPKVDWKDYVWVPKLDENGNPILDENGEKVMEPKLNADGTYYGEPKDENDTIAELTYKKRWDGHNAGNLNHINQHDGEKIKIQLQYLNEDKKWVEFNDPDYQNYYYYKNDDGSFVNKNDVVTGTDIAEANRLKIYFSRDKSDWEYYQTPEGEYVDVNSLTTPKTNPGSNDRFRIYLDYERWNNVVLSIDGLNNPQHFTNGYYYNWNNLPYHHYRVVEMQTFIDNNNNDKFDEGDIDTSSEYYYMTFPPARDSSGMLHMQNFTEELNISVQKEWYTDETGSNEVPYDQIAQLGAPFEPYTTFEVYRSTSIGNPAYDAATGSARLKGNKNATMERIQNKVTGTYHFTVDENGYCKVLSDSLKKTDEEGNKYYYYIREILPLNFTKVPMDGQTSAFAPDEQFMLYKTVYDTEVTIAEDGECHQIVTVGGENADAILEPFINNVDGTEVFTADANGYCKVDSAYFDVLAVHGEAYKYYVRNLADDTLREVQYTDLFTALEPNTRYALYRSTASGLPKNGENGTYYVKNAGDMQPVYRESAESALTRGADTDTDSNFYYSDESGVKLIGTENIAIDPAYIYYARDLESEQFTLISNGASDGFFKGTNGRYCVAYDDGPENRALVMGNAPAEMSVPFNSSISKYEFITEADEEVHKELPGAVLELKSEGYQQVISSEESKDIPPANMAEVEVYKYVAVARQLDAVKTDVKMDKDFVEGSTSVVDTLRFTSSEQKAVVDRLPAGVYTLTEKNAPYGYEIADPIRFVVDQNGKTILLSEGQTVKMDADGNFQVYDKEGNPTANPNFADTIEMLDEKLDTFTIGKEALTKDSEGNVIPGGSEIPGAEMTLTGEKSLEDVGFNKEDTNKDPKIIGWTSDGETPAIFTELPDGTYTLTESQNSHL